MTGFFKKAAIVAIAATAINVAAIAQSSFVKGDNVVGVSIGFGGYYSGTYYRDVTRIPYIALYYENCVKDNLFDEKSAIGIGAMVGHTSVTWSDFYRTSTTNIGIRGSLHYAFVEKLDAYTGLMLGYNIVSWKWLGTSPGYGDGNAASRVYGSWFLGARYYFNDNVAVFSELGYGAAVFNVGLALKF